MKRIIVAALTAVSLAVCAPALARDPRHDRGGHEDRGGGDHRQSHWERGQRDWWRGQDEWRGYEGRRQGFWYAPGRGYYRADSRWYGHQWRRGEYLPYAYREYVVSDWAYFGLRPPPRGYDWVYCGDDLVLVSVSSGLILDVLPGVY